MNWKIYISLIIKHISIKGFKDVPDWTKCHWKTYCVMKGETHFIEYNEFGIKETDLGEIKENFCYAYRMEWKLSFSDAANICQRFGGRLFAPDNWNEAKTVFGSLTERYGMYFL